MKRCEESGHHFEFTVVFDVNLILISHKCHPEQKFSKCIVAYCILLLTKYVTENELVL